MMINKIDRKALHLPEQVRSRRGGHGRGVLQASAEGGNIQAGESSDIFLETEMTAFLQFYSRTKSNIFLPGFTQQM